jgi:hypothetical protein
VAEIGLGLTMDLGHRQLHAGADHRGERATCLLDVPCPTHVSSCPTPAPYLDGLVSIGQQNRWLGKRVRLIEQITNISLAFAENLPFTGLHTTISGKLIPQFIEQVFHFLPSFPLCEFVRDAKFWRTGIWRNTGFFRMFA